MENIKNYKSHPETFTVSCVNIITPTSSTKKLRSVKKLAKRHVPSQEATWLSLLAKP